MIAHFTKVSEKFFVHCDCTKDELDELQEWCIENGVKGERCYHSCFFMTDETRFVQFRLRFDVNVVTNVSNANTI